MDFCSLLFSFRRFKKLSSQCDDTTEDEFGLSDLSDLACERWKSFKFLKDLAGGLLLTDFNSSSIVALDALEKPPGCDSPVLLTGCGSYPYPLWFLVRLKVLVKA